MTVRLIKLMAQRMSIAGAANSAFEPIWIRNDQIAGFAEFHPGSCHVILLGGAEYIVKGSPQALAEALDAVIICPSEAH